MTGINKRKEFKRFKEVQTKYNCFFHLFSSKKKINYRQPTVKLPKFEIEDSVIDELNMICSTVNNDNSVLVDLDLAHQANFYLNKCDEIKLKNKSLPKNLRVKIPEVPIELKDVVKKVQNTNKIFKKKLCNSQSSSC